MTITYLEYVATSKGFPSTFVKLLRRWRGSIYKLIYCDLLVFLGIFYFITIIYRFLLNEDQKSTFADLRNYLSAYNTQIPITFFLGFYVNTVIGRWKTQISNQPWPDPVAIVVSCIIRGNDENGRKMRRAVMRYVCVAHIMTFSLISPRVKKRFPTYDHYVEAGVLAENEKKIIMAMDEICPKQPKYWIPIIWASSIFTRARKEGRIRDDFALRTLNDTLNKFRENCIMLLHHDTISIPLVYTQAVTFAVYAYFLASLIASQRIETSNANRSGIVPNVDYYFPLFPTLDFFFYMGWLKVAETLICPFGDDDDDFEVNSVIDRNFQVSYIIVDEMHNRHPQLIRDQYWDEVYPIELPGGGSVPPEYSTAKIEQRVNSLKNSDTQIELESESKAQSLWRRVRENRSNIISMEENLTDSERNISEEFVNKLQHSLSSEKLSNIAIHPEFEEESQEEDTSEGYTFERLREEREREKIERQHNKVQRTVDNVAEVTAELPIKTFKRESPRASEEDSQESDENQNNKDKNGKTKKQDE